MAKDRKSPKEIAVSPVRPRTDAATHNPAAKRLLLESEVAERLRCSTTKVKRLRLDGKLPFISGRPVLVDEQDLAAFIEKLKCEALLNFEKIRNQAFGTSIGLKDAEANASQRARQLWLRRKHSSEPGS